MEKFKPMEVRETDLTNRHIVIVGASNGLGHALARQLATEGSTLHLLGRSMSKKELDFEAYKYACDIKSPIEVMDTFKRIDKATPSIDVLINCAGVGLVKPLDDTHIAEVKNVVETNLMGAIFTTMEAYSRMVAQGNGHIVNVSSTTGIKFRDQETIYAASKWGLRGFTESLRMEGAKHGVRVSGIYPGGMQNENFWQIVPGKDISGYMDSSVVAGQIVNVLKSDPSICPSEVVIERAK